MLFKDGFQNEHGIENNQNLLFSNVLLWVGLVRVLQHINWFAALNWSRFKEILSTFHMVSPGFIHMFYCMLGKHWESEWVNTNQSSADKTLIIITALNIWNTLGLRRLWSPVVMRTLTKNYYKLLHFFLFLLGTRASLCLKCYWSYGFSCSMMS